MAVKAINKIKNGFMLFIYISSLSMNSIVFSAFIINVEQKAIYWYLYKFDL
tara:strand:- start:611 stop:763 length:153 start_codon:yes stop_codon:yes gene_type:complete